MPVLQAGGRALELTEDGFLADAAAWDEAVAEALAERAGLVLAEAHWEIVRYVREYYHAFGHLPNARMFAKAVQKRFGPEKGGSRYLHGLFPDGPVRCACLVAGLPKPPGCL